MSILLNYESILNECNVIYTDGTITAFIDEFNEPHHYYTGYIAVTSNSELFGFSLKQLNDVLTKDYRITYNDFTKCNHYYVIGFDDLANKLGLDGVKAKLQTLVEEVKLFTKDTNVAIAEWFHTAKPEPTNQNIIQQMAYHFEEVAEMCQAIHCDYMAEQLKGLKAELLKVAQTKEESDNFISTVDKVALLDALADQQVTAIGVGILFGFNMKGALAEVNRSNWTKFINGKPIINEQGKITQGTLYKKPNLEPFV